MDKVIGVSAGPRRMVRCPRCGFAFDITYGRAFACSGCSSSVHCTGAKCPRCRHEFPLTET